MGVTFIAPQEVYTAPAKLIEKTITDNGTFTATDDNANGYSSVAVNVPLPTGKITITENGTNINIAQYATADVNVAGGGGSSDFSTAEVSLTVGAPSTIQGACIIEDEYGEYIETSYPTQSSDPQIISAVLYKGESTVMIQTQGTLNVSGNIQQMVSNAYNITGDCTITIS